MRHTISLIFLLGFLMFGGISCTPFYMKSQSSGVPKNGDGTMIMSVTYDEKCPRKATVIRMTYDKIDGGSDFINVDRLDFKNPALTKDFSDPTGTLYIRDH